MIVACVKVGMKYGPEYVNRLAAMLARHTTRPYQFVCLTDDTDGVGLSCPWRHIDTNLPGWWAKLVLFSGIFERQAVYLDLDTVIVTNADFLFDYAGPFCILKDWWASGNNSSVMSIAPGFGRKVWEKFQKNPNLVMTNYSGDQDFITDEIPKADLWQEVAPGKIGSYKADKLEMGPRAFSLVCFHGVPKPHEFTEGWVRDAWLQTGERIPLARV